MQTSHPRVLAPWIAEPFLSQHVDIPYHPFYILYKRVPSSKQLIIMNSEALNIPVHEPSHSCMNIHSFI